ncbi:putative cytosol aminopeptidase [Rickettsiales bacterium]|nr:putative cytosol aminopeptidase [Rickettsiales bacterium]
MEITFREEIESQTQALVFFVFEDTDYISEALKDQQDFIQDLIKTNSFQGKRGEFLTFFISYLGSIKKIIFVGLGKSAEFEQLSSWDAGGQAYSQLSQRKNIKHATLYLADPGLEEPAHHVVYGTLLKSFSFDKYQNQHKNHLSLSVIAAKGFASTVEAKFRKLEAIAAGISLAKNLTSEPPNILYPESFAQIIDEKLTAAGAKVEILGEQQMQSLGMGALLGVGQGSIRESKLAVMSWQGTDASVQPIAFVGKGVTFDSGGISIKPANGMEEMKYDMAGAATVVGLMYALALNKVKINAVGVVGLVENMPSDNAQRPSDIVTSMSGKTIEVINTDAEGRLVLADALYYVQSKFNPKYTIDLATLTGAAIIALGSQYAALLSNDDELADQLTKSGKATGEKLWRLPLNPHYDKFMDSGVADVRNTSAKRGPGTITAAQFLQRFVNKTPWAHLDIAAVAWNKEGTDICKKGATAFGVELLYNFADNLTT